MPARCRITGASGWAGSRRRRACKDFRTHRLRDTFAVELLLADVSIDDVSVLLGHSSVHTTERYYAPWDRSRRDRLARIVRDAHKRDPLLAELYGDPRGGTGRGLQRQPRPAARPGRPDSVRARKSMISGNIRPIRSSLPMVSAGQLPMRFRDCQGGCIWKSGSFAAQKSSGSPGLSRTSIYRKMRSGTFPLPVKLGERAVAWRADEIHDWIASRPRPLGWARAQ